MKPADDRGLDALGQRLLDMIRTRDVARLEAVLDDDFVHIGDGGERESGAEFLAAIAGGEHVIERLGFERVAHELVDGVGVTCGVQVAVVRLADGTVVTARTGFTDVFSRRDGEWRLRLVASTDLTGQAPAAGAGPDPEPHRAD